MSKAAIDRLGEQLRTEVTPEALTQLDAYRRGFRGAYDAVVDRLRLELGLEVSGRPAKSTTAIVEKLRRSPMRLAQMQDIAGCRVVVPDITGQSSLVGRLEEMFDVTLVDRRSKPSHGYRAVHVIVRSELPVEIQVRTELQHVWAELSEKLADTYGIGLKYGGGPSDIRRVLDEWSVLIAEFEQHLDLEEIEDVRITTIRQGIRDAMVNLSIAMRRQQ
jgi:ppGpp synthetase/RelA/SpoT-type nucleotidyltranferase